MTHDEKVVACAVEIRQQGGNVGIACEIIAKHFPPPTPLAEDEETKLKEAITHSMTELCKSLQTQNANCRVKLLSLRARIAELEKDKVRLDWLESNDEFAIGFPSDGKFGKTGWSLLFSDDANDICGKPTLREAIDAAIQPKPKP